MIDRIAATIKNYGDSDAMRVWRMRKTFDDFVKKISKSTPEGLAKIAPEDRATLMRLRTLKVRQRGFSDSFTISVSLQDDGGPEDTARAGFAIWTLLVASAGITLVALATGMPIRGGVAVGTGVDLFPEEIYGAALLDAYRLESQVADYPRVAVGPQLFEFLKYLEELSPQVSQFNRVAAETARATRQLICDAPDDGWPMLHLLSPEMSSLMPNLDECRGLAHKWVREQVARYGEEGNEKLFPPL